MSTPLFKKEFDALKGAQPKTSLLSADEARSQLGRQISSARKPGFPTLTLMCIAAFVAIGTTVYFMLPQNKSVDFSQAPKASSQAYSATASAATVVQPPPIAQPKATIHVVTPPGVTNSVTTAPVAEKPTSVVIAGVPFLDLEADEFAQLPDVLTPEIVTHRTSSFQNGVQLTEKRSLECLLHTPDASSVIDNGQEYIQTRALFIPIRVQEISSTNRTETVRWYRPTGELIALLPERYRVRMMIEMNLLSEIQRGCITPREACRALPHSQSYFDMCRMDASRIKDVVISPNPIRYSGKANVTLKYQAILHIALFSTNGSYITELFPQTSLDAGEYALDITTQGIPAGIYLLTVTTNDGEHVVRQIIIE